MRLFDSHFLLVYISGLKYILARQILQFKPVKCATMPDKVIIISLLQWFSEHLVITDEILHFVLYPQRPRAS